MLYCQLCRQVVSEGDNQCRACGNGFVSQLLCGGCNQPVERGATSCASCDRSFVQAGVVPVGVVDAVVVRREVSVVGAGAPRPAPSRGPAVPPVAVAMPLPVSETYVQRRFGVTAQVTMNGRDAEILTRMRQMSALLEAFAVEMNGLQGFMQSTRDVIKGCRKLAADLNEEVEVRLGPQG